MSANEPPRAPDAAGSNRIDERVPLTLAREGWPEFLPLEHATLPLPIELGRDGEDLRIVRARPTGRPVREGRIPRTLVPQLLLQAAAALAFFRAFGIALSEEDLTASLWERTRGGASLWLSGSPASLSKRRDAPSPSRPLAAFLDVVARRAGRIADARTSEYARFLDEPETKGLRAESLIARLFRTFPAL